MFSRLDTYKNLQVTARSRKTDSIDGRNDAVADLLSQCTYPSELARVAYRFGLTAFEIQMKAERASTFGQFRLAIGNRIRGIVSRLDRENRSGKRIDRRLLMEGAGNCDKYGKLIVSKHRRTISKR